MTTLPDSMVERVARAICASDFDGDTAVYDDLCADQRQNFVINARAAIQAMREPTPGMIEAAWQTTTACCAEERMGVLLMDGRTAHGVKMLGRWRAMIDAALEEQGQ